MSKSKNITNQTPHLFKRVSSKLTEGYFSGDKPNPNLLTFLMTYANTNASKKVTTEPKTILITNRRSALNDLHGFWSKKPHSAIEQYIKHFTQPGDLVLDPFCGSGGVGLICQVLGRASIMVDASPAAAHITAGYSLMAHTSFLSEIQKQGNALCAECEQFWTFSSGKTDYRISGILYSEMFQCAKCLNWNYIATDIPDGDDNGGLCKCGENNNLRSRKTVFKTAVPVRLFLVNQQDSKRIQIVINTSPRIWEDFDAHLKKITIKEVPIDFLSQPLAEELLNYGGRLRATGALRVRDLYTPFGLQFLYHASSFIARLQTQHHEVAQALQFLLTSCSLNFSKMYRARQKGGGLAGAFYTPPVFRQINPADSFNAKLLTFERAKIEIEQACHDRMCSPVIVSCQDAGTISCPPNTIDYIFTDPPYADTMPYGALNCVWEAIIGANRAWRSEEARESQWNIKIHNAMKSCFDSLKPGGFISICYHDTSEGTWQQLQDIMEKVGFVTEQSQTAIGIETNQKAYQQTIADKVTKRDLVINFRKPKSGEKQLLIKFTGDEDQKTFRQKAQAVIREYLRANLGSSKDRIYDAVVSRLVRKGQMEAHDFEELLRQVADEIKESPTIHGKWFLKHTEFGADEAERTTADSAGTRIHEFIVRTASAKLMETEAEFLELQSNLSRLRHTLQLVDHGKSTEPRPRLVREIRDLTVELDQSTARRAEWEKQAIHFSDIFEFYVSAVNPKPKARLEELLEDYCYQTDEGNWRPPLTEQEQKEKGSERQRAVRRTIQRFCGLLESGEAVVEVQRPDTTTLAEWIRHCRRTGLYAQGKLIYERGGLSLDQLNEEDQVSVQEDYEVCVKRLVVKPTSNPNKQQNLNV